MALILVVYGSTYGQTRRVATRLAERLVDAGHLVDVHRGDQVPSSPPVEHYRGCVVAASVLAGRYQRYIHSFVQDHCEWLNMVPSAFVSVSGAGQGAPVQAMGYIDKFRRETGWRPRLCRSFTGAVAYTRYPWWLRWYMQRISRRKGLPVDVTRDWDFTEWGEVDQLGRELGLSLVLPLARQAADPLILTL